MTIAKTGGPGKKRSGFDIENWIFHQDNIIHSLIVRYTDGCCFNRVPEATACIIWPRFSPSQDLCDLFSQ